MVPSVVKESSGLLTVTSTLYLKPTKMDAKSVFHCTVEYSMPNGDIKQANSEPFNLTLLCESHTHVCMRVFVSVQLFMSMFFNIMSSHQTQPRTSSSSC